MQARRRLGGVCHQFGSARLCSMAWHGYMGNPFPVPVWACVQRTRPDELRSVRSRLALHDTGHGCAASRYGGISPAIISPSPCWFCRRPTQPAFSCSCIRIQPFFARPGCSGRACHNCRVSLACRSTAQHGTTQHNVGRGSCPSFNLLADLRGRHATPMRV